MELEAGDIPTSGSYWTIQGIQRLFWRHNDPKRLKRAFYAPNGGSEFGHITEPTRQQRACESVRVWHMNPSLGAYIINTEEGSPALHHNGGACASWRPAVIEKEIAQLKKTKRRRSWVGAPKKQSGPQIPPARAVRNQCALFCVTKWGKLRLPATPKTQHPNAGQKWPGRPGRRAWWDKTQWRFVSVEFWICFDWFVSSLKLIFLFSRVCFYIDLNLKWIINFLLPDAIIQFFH